LFLISFALHAIWGARAETIENALHGDLTQISAFQYIGESKFWFESFQNWQSEFLIVGVLIVLSIFLREEGSPQSKKVETPNSKNEEEAA
jgi:hypothetical protein